MSSFFETFPGVERFINDGQNSSIGMFTVNYVEMCS